MAKVPTTRTIDGFSFTAGENLGEILELRLIAVLSFLCRTHAQPWKKLEDEYFDMQLGLRFVYKILQHAGWCQQCFATECDHFFDGFNFARKLRLRAGMPVAVRDSFPHHGSYWNL